MHFKDKWPFCFPPKRLLRSKSAKMEPAVQLLLINYIIEVLLLEGTSDSIICLPQSISNHNFLHRILTLNAKKNKNLSDNI